MIELKMQGFFFILGIYVFFFSIYRMLKSLGCIRLLKSVLVDFSYYYIDYKVIKLGFYCIIFNQIYVWVCMWIYVYDC